MTRLTDLHLALAEATAKRWDPRSVDVAKAVHKARAQRSEFVADHLGRAFTGVARVSGLTALTAALRDRWECRRTARALAELDDRLLSDIGVIRADIEAVAAQCPRKPKSSGTKSSGKAARSGPAGVKPLPAELLAATQVSTSLRRTATAPQRQQTAA